MDDEQIYEALETIREECERTAKCKDCKYSCKSYFVARDGIKETNYACVLKETPYRWQLETMEGFNNGR